MAKLKMADYTGGILIEAPRSAWGIQTVEIGEAGLYPGYPVTQTGETVPAVVYGAAASDVFYGILLENADDEIETEFTSGDRASCLIAGSRGSCWSWAKASVASLQVGTRLHQDTAGPSHFLIVVETMAYENAGLVIEYSATSTDDRPVKICLTG